MTWPGLADQSASPGTTVNRRWAGQPPPSSAPCVGRRRDESAENVDSADGAVLLDDDLVVEVDVVERARPVAPIDRTQIWTVCSPAPTPGNSANVETDSVWFVSPVGT